MSAFIPDKTHIDIMVELAAVGPSDCKGKWGGGSTNSYAGGLMEHLDEVGQMLLDEVVASVSYLYPGDNLDQLPGPNNAYYVNPYAFESTGMRLTTVEGLAATYGYEYQACECPDYISSHAHRFCEELRNDLIQCLPNYNISPHLWHDNDTPVATLLRERLRSRS